MKEPLVFLDSVVTSMRSRLLPICYPRFRWGGVLLLVFVLGIAACDSGGGGGEPSEGGGLDCTFPVAFLNEGANRGEITPVNNPALVEASEAEEILPAFSGTDRVIALPPSFHPSYPGTPLAVPLDVLFESEIMNLDGWARRPLAITFCPLTSSTLVFDREAINGARFEISGLLLNNDNEDHPGNLVMVDTDEEESLWPQMSAGAVCGPDRGTRLTTLPAIEMQWARWKELYPNTKVAIDGDASRRSGAREARQGVGEEPSRLEGRLEVPLGRVLGIPSRQRVGGGTGGIAIPFEDLDDGTPVRVIEVTVNRETIVVFWERAARAAMAFRTTSSFSVRNENIVDDRTQSVWAVDGRALQGARQGERLAPVESAYIAAGRAWFDFQPDSELWESP